MEAPERESVRPEDESEIEARARRENSADLWDRLWSRSESRDWRRAALSRVYTRIERIIPKRARVVDLAGGAGDLADRLEETRDARVVVVDHSEKALELAREKGVSGTLLADLEEEPPDFESLRDEDELWFVATELLEHLSEKARRELLRRVSISIAGAMSSASAGALFSVPNARLGPEEEHQHTIAFNARTLRAELEDFFSSVRVEVLGPFLLAVVGKPAEKGFRLSACLPVRDEEADLEGVLASFRGVADELVVGVDPRTVDGTRAIADRYADVVFELEDPACQDPSNPLHDPNVPESGVHFAWCRNQVLDRCSGDWCFMTEGHERLLSGIDSLLVLDRIVPPEAEIAFVLRQGNNQRWGYPWLFRARPGFRYERSVHNELRYPTGTKVVHLPQVVTLHDRDHGNAKARARQRGAQNRETLLDDWKTNENAASLFYFAQEVRADEPAAAIARFQEFLELERRETNGLTRYQARLMLAKLLANEERFEEARDVLVPASGDDWSRTEHFIWLGDLAFREDQLEEALTWYRYAGTVAGEPPFTLWWVDLSCYSYLPCQRLAQCYSYLGRGEEALSWARRYLELLPDDAPAIVFDEARENIRHLEDALEEIAAAGSPGS